MSQKTDAMAAYNPERKAQGEKVLVGLSGGYASMVAAYLLKIQKYEVFAATVLLSDDTSLVRCALTESRRQEIVSFCERLGIAHQFIHFEGRFKEEVESEWVAARLEGRASTACLTCHDLRLTALYKLMREQGIARLATGHYAKVFSGVAAASGDLSLDDSLRLSRLPAEVLGALLLPLSDLQSREVLKLAENFGIAPRSSVGEDCFPESAASLERFQKQVPASLIRSGEIIWQDADGESKAGVHDGVQEHAYGKVFRLEEHTGARFVRYLPRDRRMILSSADFFQRREILLVGCRFAPEGRPDGPIRALLRLGAGSFVDCWVTPKSLSQAWVELDEARELREGVVLGVYQKKGKNQKVLLSGRVRFVDRPLAPESEESPKPSYGSF
jgi:tRNA U34 2-thiouridine synthase MnmA/TrmU